MPTILIVDDPAAFALGLTRLLELQGYRVIHALDGVAALRSLAAEAPDLALLDLHMSPLGGLGVLGAIRADPRLARLPVFLMTAVHDADAVAQARRLGIQEYLFKGDVTFAGLLWRVKRHLGEAYQRPRRGRKPKVPGSVDGASRPPDGPARRAGERGAAPVRDRAFWADEVASWKAQSEALEE